MYNPQEIEKEVLEFWTQKKIYYKTKDKNKGKEKFYFLQGPPYTNGKIHLGQAWNNSMKDFVLRYRRMSGFDVWDRAGWDMHGLPTESKIQKKFNLESKEEIEKFGISKFINECLEFSKENAEVMSQDLLKLGVWLDYENPYMSINEEWIESAWFLVKEVNNKKRLYEGEKTMMWDPVTETALAKHECVYKKIVDKSIFVKFKLRNEDKYLIIWTTTPWTIPFNLAIMINPELDYVETEVDGEKWIIAKNLADEVIKNKLKKEYLVLDEFKGAKLKGMKYIHPWASKILEFTKLQLSHPNIHTVVLSKEYVNLDSGTGLVHCAPGCGPEDYEVGYQNKIPPFNNLDERGYFPNTMGIFSGFRARTDDYKFIKILEDDGAIVGKLNYEHDYPHSERSGEPVIFRKTRQWFFKVEDLKNRMIELNNSVHWVPITAKNAFDSWLDNLRDNSITRQRYWGIPVPIWKCNSCNNYLVIGDKKELASYSGKMPENLHRPWVDEIIIKCSCGGTKKRIPDVLDVWIDAGIASFACLYYPQRKDLFEKLFPADFILEGKDQIRGWFNLLMVSSILAFNREPFKNIYMHGFITDVEGEKMSKSLGNVISPNEVTEKHGVDTLRLYVSQTNSGEDINFSWDEIKSKYKSLSILWNIHNYLLDYCRTLNIDPTMPIMEYELEEKYILSKLNKVVRETTELYEFYHLDKIPKVLEEFILDLSRDYIQDTREKIYEKPQLVLSTIYICLTEFIKMFSTVCPFISEKIYQNLKLPFNLNQESVTLEDWPIHNSKLINEDLEKNYAITQEIIRAGLAAREKAKKGVRWPLSKIEIVSVSTNVKELIESFGDLIKSKLNIKNIELLNEFTFDNVDIKPNKTTIGRDFKQHAPEVLKKLDDNTLKEIYKIGEYELGEYILFKDHILIEEKLPSNLTFSEFSLGKVILDSSTSEELELEGYAREVIRRIQDLRKENGLKKSDMINLSIESSYSLEKMKSYFKEKVGATLIEFKDKNYSIKDEIEIKGKKFKITFVKL